MPGGEAEEEHGKEDETGGGGGEGDGVGVGEGGGGFGEIYGGAGGTYGGGTYAGGTYDGGGGAYVSGEVGGKSCITFLRTTANSALFT